MTKKFNPLSLAAVAGLVAIVGLAIYFNQSSHVAETTPPPAQRQVAGEPGYCIAIRGNGELEPAHWGAMARTIEQLGLPSKMAGGSSATITMMVMEAIASHPSIAGQPLEIQKQRASLLWKSLYGFFGDELTSTNEWKALISLYGKFAAAEKNETVSPDQFADALKLLNPAQSAQPQTKAQAKKAKQAAIQTIQKALLSGSSQLSLTDSISSVKALKQAQEMGAIDAKTLAPIEEALKAHDQKKADFYIQQLKETAAVFGKFNAQTDDNLFFRGGLVSFENAAVSFGQIASFYSATNESPENIKAWDKLFDTCTPGAEGKTWREIVAANPQCKDQLHALFKTTQTESGHFEEKTIGQTIAVFPITAILTGSAAEDFRQARQQYNEQLDPHFGKNFHIRDANDVRIGYWGDPQLLQSMASQLTNTDDAKSKRFLALGSAKWKQVLSLSPAEPGLSPLKDFSVNGQSYISAGGWPDLHPVGALKAAGCENVVYFTRQGGESLFGQGVAKRLLNLERDWSYFDTTNPATKEAMATLNDNGDPSDMNSAWSNLYNLANPLSSENRSFAQASAIFCTNWNAYDIKKDFQPLVEDSYHSAYWINPKLNTAFVSGLTPVLNDKKPGCHAP